MLWSEMIAMKPHLIYRNQKSDLSLYSELISENKVSCESSCEDYLSFFSLNGHFKCCYFDWSKYSGHVLHMILFSFLFYLIIICGMMWTHFSFHIFAEYETLNIILTCFDGNKQWFEKKQKRKDSNSGKKKIQNNKKFISLGQMIKCSCFFHWLFTSFHLSIFLLLL